MKPIYVLRCIGDSERVAPRPTGGLGLQNPPLKHLPSGKQAFKHNSDICVTAKKQPNTCYICYIRPGVEVLEAAGGLHK